MEKAESTPNYATIDFVRNELNYQADRINKLRNKIKLLVRILVDKKIIGEEIAKSFEETDPTVKNTEEVLEWYLEQKKQK